MSILVLMSYKSSSSFHYHIELFFICLFKGEVVLIPIAEFTKTLPKISA
jgi:hypothetical protein